MTAWFAYDMIARGNREQQEREHELWKASSCRHGRPECQCVWEPMEYSPYASGAVSIHPVSYAQQVKQAAQEVFNILGVGHSEFIYEAAMEIELWERSLFTANIRRQVPCPIYYKGYMIGSGNIDLLINDNYIVELKAVAKITGKDTAQLRKYLSGMRLDQGLLINFNPTKEEVEIIEPGTEENQE